MPQFLISDGTHYVSYVTGPRSLLLGIRFCAKNTVPRLSVIRRSSSAITPPGEEVLRAVVAGVARSSLSEVVEEVIIADSDSAPLALYDRVAFLLADAIARGETFQHANIQKA